MLQYMLEEKHRRSFLNTFFGEVGAQKNVRSETVAGTNRKEGAEARARALLQRRS